MVDSKYQELIEKDVKEGQVCAIGIAREHFGFGDLLFEGEKTIGRAENRKRGLSFKEGRTRVHVSSDGGQVVIMTHDKKENADVELTVEGLNSQNITTTQTTMYNYKTKEGNDLIGAVDKTVIHNGVPEPGYRATPAEINFHNAFHGCKASI